MVEFKMPSLGADMEDGTLVEWLVKPGDIVKRGDIIAMVDTQKGLIDIEVFDEGTIAELLIKENEKVPVGTVMALIAGSNEVIHHLEKPVMEQVSETTTPKEVVKAVGIPETPEPKHRIKASPLARKIAADKGIDLTRIIGSGEGGAISKEDVEKAIIEQMAPLAGANIVSDQLPDQKAESIEIKKGASTESIRMAVAAAMSKSNREIPHYYLETKIDMSKALAWLMDANKKRTLKQRLLPVVLILKAISKALVEFPDLNSYWADGLQHKEAINIGFVISLRTGGLMIPAIHNVNNLSIDEIMNSLNDIIPRARAMKLRSSELSESTFTVTSLGEKNAETVYGVIYPPQVAIAGIGSITEQAWAENGMLAVRPVLNITLSADHRATDGATGSRFLMAVKKYLLEPESL
ncbi:dihydrolipoamide acetyltransferase family protein [Daejeonella oryzae]|uniref:dihydrolipoamide acetyltransferase family protein n=1 Tax=Daejeonella oryzae TaxID=1122943 RepID=UPI0003FEE71F|nr:dihydrolipoamide acetyltransferase family protein [Daejeonella oryzae]